jgi:hypothetical protein
VKSRENSARGLSSGGLPLSGPLCEMYWIVVPSPLITRFEMPISIDLNAVPAPIAAAAT